MDKKTELKYLFNETIVYLNRIWIATDNTKYRKIAENLSKDYWLKYEEGE